MPDNQQPDRMRDVWQTQEVEKVTITMDEIRRRADRWERRIRRRNLREYAAGAIATAVLLFQARHFSFADGWPVWLLIAGTAWMMWQLHRRGSAKPIPGDLGVTGSVRFYRQELERQRDALRAVWSWYLLPLVPGLVAVMANAAMHHRINAVWYVCLGAFPLGLAAIWKLNKAAAARIERKIEEMKSFE